MKSGTTSLFKYISSHPDIFPCDKKEPHFFSKHYGSAGALNTYLARFKGAKAQKYLLEASTSYTKRPVYEGVAERIHELSPDARIIYLVRDPFERIISHYRHSVARMPESRTLTDLVKTDVEYLSYSYYAQQVKPFLSIFGRENVYLCTFESLTGDPRRCCEKLFRWLDIDSAHVGTVYKPAYNRSRDQLCSLDESRFWGRQALRCKRSRLARHIPARWRERRFTRRIFPYKTARDIGSESLHRDMIPARELLSPLLSSWTRELQKIFPLTFEQWESAHTGQNPAYCIPPELAPIVNEIQSRMRTTGPISSEDEIENSVHQ